jgi:hypothetical protein
VEIVGQIPPSRYPHDQDSQRMCFHVCCLAVGSPQEDQQRGDWLLTSCQVAVRAMDDPNFKETSDKNYQLGYCEGIIQGVFDTSLQVCPAGLSLTGS